MLPVRLETTVGAARDGDGVSDAGGGEAATEVPASLGLGRAAGRRSWPWAPRSVPADVRFALDAAVRASGSVVSGADVATDADATVGLLWSHPTAGPSTRAYLAVPSGEAAPELPAAGGEKEGAGSGGAGWGTPACSPRPLTSAARGRRSERRQSGHHSCGCSRDRRRGVERPDVRQREQAAAAAPAAAATAAQVVAAAAVAAAALAAAPSLAAEL